MYQSSPNPPVLRFNSIHHIAIIGSDYERTLDFYVNKLGFPIIRENYRPDKSDYKIDLSINQDTELEIFIKPNAPVRSSHPEACGLRHLSLRVTQIEEIMDKLKASGITCDPIRRDDFTGEKLAFFYDPDGLPIELHE